MKNPVFWNVLKPEFSLFGILIILLVVFAVSSPVFFTPGNILEVLRQSSIDAILILGVTWLISAGEIDAGFPDVAAFASMMTVVLVNRGNSWGIAILATIACSILFGVLNGFLVTELKFPSLIATIGVSGLAKALASILGRGQVIPLGNNTGNFVYPIVWGRVGGIPFLLIVSICLYSLFAFVQNRIRFGQYIFALGENRIASQEAGINEKRILKILFILSSLFGAIGGILMATVLQSGQPKLGVSLFLDGFTAIFLGAMLIKLGKPNIIGTLFGAILLSLLSNGLTLLGAQFYVGMIIKGCLLIIGVSIVALTGLKFSRKERKVFPNKG
jgi:ribose/xylose/arabinose/galactoside ABC-type transport system permease subunit